VISTFEQQRDHPEAVAWLEEGSSRDVWLCPGVLRVAPQQKLSGDFDASPKCAEAVAYTVTAHGVAQLSVAVWCVVHLVEYGDNGGLLRHRHKRPSSGDSSLLSDGGSRTSLTQLHPAPHASVGSCALKVPAMCMVICGLHCHHVKKLRIRLQQSHMHSHADMSY